ncbi:MAG TPA: hypothetical protein VK154_08785 [Chitinophagales bacterium]|nr:hypothetical protein [Chitinophagales bacterium]
MSGCKKEQYTLVGNWQLTNFSQVTIASYFYPNYVDTVVFKMNNSIIHYTLDGVEKDPYGLLMQMNIEDDSVHVTEIISAIGASSTTKAYAGRWIYDGRKVFWGVPASSHLYNRVPNVNLGQADFTVEKLTSEVLVLGSHYRIFSADSTQLYDNNSTITFSRYK